MKDSTSNDSPAPAPETGFAPWKALKGKRISYLTLPLLLMATITEFVILATGWKYQQTVCLPKGMGVVIFGIGPIGATILAVELLKLPLAIWTASRRGWQKGFMLVFGLPLICVLTFQLVKDMAVYEMGVALTPANQYLDQATAEEVKIDQLNGDLKAIEAKKTEHEQELTELAAKKAKSQADLDDALKHNEDLRTDAVNLTDYQKKELNEVESREAAATAQANADAAQVNKDIADLRSRRETELGRAAQWTAEDARIDNEYKARLSDYQNKKAAYEKAKSEYDSANVLKRQFMKEPIDPGVPPVRPDNTLVKPAALAEIDAQIQAKEDELQAVNNKRRDRIAQIETDARQLRAEFDQRSVQKREQADQKRDALLAAETAQVAQWADREKQADAELAAAVQKRDGIRAELDEARKTAEQAYEDREAAIRKTQVHRIATTVEIVRALIKGEHPMSIKMTAKERGDILTDQISMVRIWVYPVLAFIVAFLPTLMVEIGFSTLFHPEKERPPHRLGFLGRRLHELYMRAGRIKMLRLQREAAASHAQLAARDRAIEDKDREIWEAREALAAADSRHEERAQRKEQEHAAQLKHQEEEWVAKLSGMADTLNRTALEKDALRDMQKIEVERQIQLRQNAWQDRLSQLSQELDSQRTAAETERTILMQAHQKKLMEVTEDAKAQVLQARRHATDAELASVDAVAKLTNDLKEAQIARDQAAQQLQQQAETFSVKLAQAREEGTREVEKAVRQEKHRGERQQMELEKSLRQREEEFDHLLKQREQEMSLAFEAHLASEQHRMENAARRRETEIERQIDARVVATEARWKQEIQQRENTAQTRLNQREQQLQAQYETRLVEVQNQAEGELRLLKADWERQLETQAREAEVRAKQELQQKEIAFQTKAKQREQELNAAATMRENEVQNQWRADLRAREEEWQRQSAATAQALEAQFAQEARLKEETYQAQARQSDQQWQAKLEAVRADLKLQAEDTLRRRLAATDATLRDLDAKLRQEMKEKEESLLAQSKQREQELQTRLTAQSEFRLIAAQAEWEKEWQERIGAAVEPLKTLLSRTEKERDEARQTAAQHSRDVQALERKLGEASTFFSSWRLGHGNGFSNGRDHANGNGNSHSHDSEHLVKVS